MKILKIAALVLSLIAFSTSANATIGLINSTPLTNTAATGNASVAVTTANDFPPGTLVVAYGYTRTTSSSVSSCADPSSNTWTVQTHYVFSTNSENTNFAWTYVAAGKDIPSGSSISCTWSSSTGTKGLIVAGFSGIASSPTVDTTGGYPANWSSGSTSAATSPSLTVPVSGSLGASSELLIGGIALNTALVTMSAPGTNFNTLGGTDSTAEGYAAYYSLVTGTSATWNPTLSGSGSAWSGTVIGFEVSGGGGTTTCTYGLMGVGKC